MPRNLEGHIRKTDDGKRWFARLRYTDNNGDRREKKRICITHAGAKATISQLKSEVERERSDRVTFPELDSYYRREYVHEARFVGDRKVSGFRQNLYSIGKYLDAALEYFGDRYIDEIGYADLKAYKDKIAGSPTIHGKQRSVSDTNQFLKRLRRLFSVAVQNDWLAKNPFAKGDRLIDDSFEVERTRVLSAAEEKALLAACQRKRSRLAPIIVFAIETGMRRGEVQSLRWSSVDLNKRIVKVESRNSKTLKSRLVPLSAKAVEVLGTQWQNSRRRNSELVFGGSDFKRAFLGACADSGLNDLHFHDLRHTAITRWLEKGISPALAMKASGHSQMKTFLRYVNQSEDSVYEFALRLDQANGLPTIYNASTTNRLVARTRPTRNDAG
jgi:integrase